MSVIHILRDGTQVKDITGHVVKVKDAEPLYDLIREINRKRSELKSKKEKEVTI